MQSIIGVEAEAAVYVPPGSQHEWSSARVIGTIVGGISLDHPHLARGMHGIFTGLGSYYQEMSHFSELATAEHQNPLETGAYLEAQRETILASGLRRLPVRGVRLSYSNYWHWGTGASCGFHVNTWSRDKKDPEGRTRLCLPLAITRLLEGQGSLGGGPHGFVLSAKARDIQRDVSMSGSCSVPGSKPLCFFRAESHAHRGARHCLASGDGAFGHKAVALAAGKPALFHAMLDAGFAVSRVELRDPYVEVLHRANADPTLSVKFELRDGRSVSLLELDELYLADARRFARTADAPSWATDLVELWHERNSAIRERGWVEGLARDYDGPMKIKALKQAAGEMGLAWEAVAPAYDTWLQLRHLIGDRARLEAALSGPAGFFSRRRQSPRARQWADTIETIDELAALDVFFLSLGADGWLCPFDQLEQQGWNRHRLVSRDLVQRARDAQEPLPGNGTRAELRSRLIRELHTNGDSAYCDWTVISSERSGEFQMQNPFASTGRWSAD